MLRNSIAIPVWPSRRWVVLSFLLHSLFQSLFWKKNLEAFDYQQSLIQCQGQWQVQSALGEEGGREKELEAVWSVSSVAIYTARKITVWTVNYSSHVRVPRLDSMKHLHFKLCEGKGNWLDLPCLMIMSLASTSVSKWQAWEQSEDRPKLSSLSVLHCGLLKSFFDLHSGSWPSVAARCEQCWRNLGVFLLQTQALLMPHATQKHSSASAKG